MKKLLIIGDSLSMSRHEDGIGYEEMYSSHLAIAFPERLIVNASERANSSNRISSSSYLGEYVYPMKPDVTVIQIGVVDCLPRLLTDYQRRIVSIGTRFRITRGVTTRYLEHLSNRRYQITKKRPISFVSRADFEKNLSLIKSVLISENPHCKFVVIGIPCPSKALTEKSYGADDFVREYNNILRNVFNCKNSKFIEFYEATKNNPSLLLHDGYHISGLGHNYLFHSTRDILSEWAF
ncbi:MAG: GDSL-type esterase/lipase family protein [Gallionellaceae bacterium]|jgi:lysophospholipase L1-like esterase